MKERPILFSGPMIKAILAGQKTMTRRVAKVRPSPTTGHPQLILRSPYAANLYDDGPAWSPAGGDPEQPLVGADLARHCPFGDIGDRLWVKETWRTSARIDNEPPSAFSLWPVKYLADGQVLKHGAFFGDTDGKTRVSIHMPRWASRITLEISGVRCERLQSISEEDAKAEGLNGDYVWASGAASCDGHGNLVVNQFAQLWDKINGKRPGCDWASNCWVWVVEFAVVKGIT